MNRGISVRVRRKKRQGSETRKIGGWIEIGDGPANFRGLARRDLNRPALPEASQSVAGFAAWQTVKCSRKSTAIALSTVAMPLDAYRHAQ